MAGVNRFYDEYYFRPRVAWRIVREALWDGHERKRLYAEAMEFLKFRAERLKWARRRRRYFQANRFRAFDQRQRLTATNESRSQGSGQDPSGGLGNGSVRERR